MAWVLPIVKEMIIIFTVTSLIPVHIIGTQNQVAEDSSSVELSAYDMTSALEEIDTVIHFVQTHGQDLLEGDNFTQNQSDDSINFELLTVENLMKVKGQCLRFQLFS